MESEKSILIHGTIDNMNTTANSLVDAVLMDEWPSMPTVIDYGIRTQKHYEALYFPIRRGEVTAGQLHSACLNGGKALTKLISSLSSNPHKHLEFDNPYPIFSEEDCRFEDWELESRKHESLMNGE
jgi:hypothetical protein